MEWVVDVATATRMLRAVANGWQPDDLGPLSGQPALVVDLDTAAPGYPVTLASPAPLPCVVIGLSTAATPPAAPAGCDVLLSSAPRPSRPWVGVAGPLAAAVDRLLRRISDYPTAACTLTQLVRAGEPLTVEGALVAESLAYSTLQSGPEFARWLRSRTPRAPSLGPGPSPSPSPGPGPGLGAEQPPVLVARHEATLHITLNRPQRRNAFNAAMRDALIGALEVALADDTIIEVELTGAGPAFCSGGDLDEFGSLPDPATAHLIRTTRSAGARLARCADRTTVRLHGACVGAGIELPAFAGRVIAAPDTRVMLPEVALGLVPGAGGTVSISRRIGRQRCAWLALSGEWIDSEVAADWGLVDLAERAERASV